MFEDSLLKSPRRITWTAIASLTLQCSLAAAVLGFSLLHPEELAFHTDAPKVFLQLKPAPRTPKIILAQSTRTTPTPSPSYPASPSRPLVFTHSQSAPSDSDAPPNLSPSGQMASGDPAIPGSGLHDTAGSPRISVAPTNQSRRVNVSSGVSAGLLLAPIRPVYPRIAIATHTEGVVVVEAIISKSGKIESARATSGSPMLREAAVEAVRNARYSPYLLNGNPTEVDTTITVTFRLAS